MGTTTGVSYGEVNPVKQFITSFKKSDYKITTSGIVGKEIKISEAKEGDSIKTNISTKITYDNSCFYFKNGKLVRAEIMDISQMTIISSNNKLYSINETKKTFVMLDNSMFSGEIFNYTLPIVQLIEDNEKGKLKWSKISDNEWQTMWHFNMLLLDPGEPPILTKILINKNTNLITEISFKIDTNWQSVKLKYEPIDNIDKLLIIPKGYREEKVE